METCEQTATRLESAGWKFYARGCGFYRNWTVFDPRGRLVHGFDDGFVFSCLDAAVQASLAWCERTAALADSPDAAPVECGECKRLRNALSAAHETFADMHEDTCKMGDVSECMACWAQQEIHRALHPGDARTEPGADCDEGGD